MGARAGQLLPTHLVGVGAVRHAGLADCGGRRGVRRGRGQLPPLPLAEGLVQTPNTPSFSHTYPSSGSLLATPLPAHYFYTCHGHAPLAPPTPCASAWPLPSL